MREYGGLVNQAIGEEIVSLFGVPVAHEDDDLRAVRAALELHARVRRAGSRPIAVRTSNCAIQSGLHVGAVVARRLHEGPRRYDIVGAPAAVASRLAVLADPDEVWVSPETQRLVGPYVHTSACSPVVLDSHAGPVTPFRVLGETGIATRLEASSRTGLTPYVGRQSELSTLQAHVRSLPTIGADRWSPSSAKPGAGRAGCCTSCSRVWSRRRRRARAAGAMPCLRRRRSVRRLRADPVRGSRSPAAAARARTQSPRGFVRSTRHSSRSCRSSCTCCRSRAMSTCFRDTFVANTCRRRCSTRWRRLVDVLARRGPLLVLIEDWHWADTGSRAAFMRVAELVASTPVRADCDQPRGAQRRGDGPPHDGRLGLGRLDFAASVAIVESCCGFDMFPIALARWLYDRAGGNPFFLEQMCAALLEQQAVTVRDGEAPGAKAR